MAGRTTRSGGWTRARDGAFAAAAFSLILTLVLGIAPGQGTGEGRGPADEASAPRLASFQAEASWAGARTGHDE